MALSIIFMGTPEFAVESLARIHRSEHNVVCVVTAPDRPAGRGRKLHESAVKQFAVANQIPVLQPEKLKDETFVEKLKSYKADIQVVVAFRMLPEIVWNMPPMGSFNLHASLLPQYRGAAPINWAVINGETETGVTSFFLKHQIDTGDIIDQKIIPIAATDTASTVHDKLMTLGADLVLESLRKIDTKQCQAKPQTFDGELLEAPKIFKQDCLLKLDQGVEKVHNQVRGLADYPGAYLDLLLNAKPISFKIFKTQIIGHTPSESVHFSSDNKQNLYLHLKDGVLAIEELQQSGKKRMDIGSFLRGQNTDMNLLSIVEND